MNCPLPESSSVCPESFTCVDCGRDLPMEEAAWDVDPELPLTLCLGCADLEEDAPAPTYAREVA